MKWRRLDTDQLNTQAEDADSYTVAGLGRRDFNGAKVVVVRNKFINRKVLGWSKSAWSEEKAFESECGPAGETIRDGDARFRSRKSKLFPKTGTTVTIQKFQTTSGRASSAAVDHSRPRGRRCE